MLREKTLSIGLVICSSILLCGVDRCQQDYYFAVKTKVGPTATATGDATGEPTEEATETPGGPTETPEATETPEIEDTPARTPTPPTAAHIYSKGGQAAAFLAGLSNLEKQKEKNAANITASQKQGSSSESGNWLGKIKTKDDDQKLDSDRDGYTDAMEERTGSDPGNPGSVPRLVLQTSLAQRLMSQGDKDGDGVVDQDEQDIDLSDSNSDTDGDGCLDGLEVFEGTDPANRKSVVRDSDGDCLSDSFEAESGLNPFSSDTDHDALPDGLELILGTNPLDPDVDNDGILDGKEFSLGADPLLPDVPAK